MELKPQSSLSKYKLQFCDGCLLVTENAIRCVIALSRHFYRGWLANY